MESSTISLHEALNTIHSGVVLVQQDQKITFWNQWMSEHSGRSAETVLGLTLQEVFPGTPLVRLNNVINSALKMGQSSVLSPTLHHSLLPLHVQNTRNTEPPRQSTVVKPLLAENGERSCMIQISDVSAGFNRESILRRQRQQMSALVIRHKASEALARAVIENISEALVTLDSHQKIIDMNSAAHQLFGYSDAEILGNNFLTLVADKNDISGLFENSAIADHRRHDHRYR